jgi:hypothetical protein
MEEKEILEEKKEEVLPTDDADKAAEEPQIEEPAIESPIAEEEPSPDAETPAADAPQAESEGAPEENPMEGEPQEQPAEQEPVRTFTQEQVNELVGKARAEGRKKGYEQAKMESRERYGVDDDDELDSLFANGSRYGELDARFKDSGKQLKDVRTELAMVKSRILPDRQADVKAILGANGLDVTEENIASLLPTHPEWIAMAQPQQNAPQSQGAPQEAPQQPKEKDWKPEEPIDKLGVEPNQPKEDSGDSEREKAMKMFFGNK